jgi:methyl-accepting chemotaxis protein
MKQVSNNAEASAEAARRALDAAEQGNRAVRDTLEGMQRIRSSVQATAKKIKSLGDRSLEISEIINVINDITEQTNLLALNAAIEAARAGEAGRGFAVVADEVRALAHRTQQSTREIEQMITGIQQGTDLAVSSMQQSNTRARSTLEVAKAAGVALEDIASAFTVINERNIVIASASEEQAAVAREVDRNLMNIRDLAQQSSAGASQTSAASQELSRLAVDLNTLVARFSI